MDDPRYALSLCWCLMCGLAIAGCWFCCEDPDLLRRVLIGTGVSLAVLSPLTSPTSLRLRGLACALVAAGAVPLLLMGPFPSLWATMAFLVGFALVRSELLGSDVVRGRRWAELALAGVVGLATWYFYDSSVIGLVFTVWSFWLAQALYPLLARVLPAATPLPTGFDKACGAADELLSRMESAGS